MNTHVSQVFVDLDGSLIRTDMLLEAALKLLKRNPLNIFRLAMWAVQGRALLKTRLAETVEIDYAALPYEADVVEHLKAMKADGARIVLATASPRVFAEGVAAHLPLFDDVLATEPGVNLKGVNKLKAIQESAGEAAFAYVGDSPADRPIWRAASSEILVNASRNDVRRAKSQDKPSNVIQTRPSVFKSFLKEMRVHQWAKNVLVFVPLFTSHSYYDLGAVFACLVAFASFSLCASGVYFFNDLLDLEADRKHKTKWRRPLASGDLPISLGVIGAVALPVAAFALALVFAPLAFVAVLCVYFIMTNAYSFYLKAKSTADVMTLAILYTLRVVAGAAAIGVALSSWLLGFSIFVFVSLAYLKRYIEIAGLDEGGEKAAGRGYSGADTETMFVLGASNMTAAVLVLALYVNSEEITGTYQSPILLWGLCLLMLYWGNRIWIGARRGRISDDPVVFAIKDNISRLVGLAFGGIVLAARYFSF
ncbi:MAG: UbiA family prenyltransferase [Pseudomonadota bacterium]